jgi:hypothetical protein
MDGIFINLTKNDIIIEDNIESKKYIIKARKELVPPSSQVVKKNNKINAKIETVNIGDSEEYELEINVVIPKISEYMIYPFTKDQIDIINQISRGRTRLFILEQRDVEYWSYGKFQCPFRNYRLFTQYNGKLIEYPIPKTYLDLFSETVNTTVDVSKKFYNKLE